MDSESSAIAPRSKHSRGVSLREFLGLMTILMLTVGLVLTALRLRTANQELRSLQAEVGYLAETSQDQIAASRIRNDVEPLTYRFRVRVPATGFRVAYSSLWPKHSPGPAWFGAVPVPPGESTVTVRIHEDPRDHRWKISTIIATPKKSDRMGTVLPSEHEQAFRGSHQVIRAGVGQETLAVDQSRSIRLLDERWLVGEEGLLLYGNREPEHDQIGIYAELQPDRGPL
ncbi:MAG: hypothetical protein AB8B91_24750 [Rubripirellula sp.]